MTKELKSHFEGDNLFESDNGNCRLQTNIFVTPSEVIEYLFCPRFIYFMNVLKIEQHEHKRKLVNKGRDIHALKMVHNKDYLRKKIGAIDKKIDVYLTSKKLKLVGRIDEVLFLENNEAAPLDYKFAFWEDKIYKTLRMQQTLYALLIEENFDKKVEKAFLVYVRSKNHLEEIRISENMKKEAIVIVNEIFDILNQNYFPKATKNKNKCLDCTYRNLCAV
ncbi:MAG: CRISPR-associated protein Cas4 [Candidatus Tenebribacter mawsonii]|nr:CRISPR-associated protein Cas4 [Candidatus Tenebribacter mawsonii]